MNAPVIESQLECIAQEAAATDVRSVDVLSADVDIDFNKGEIEQKYGVKVQAKIIPQAAIEAVRERLKAPAGQRPQDGGRAGHPLLLPARY